MDTNTQSSISTYAPAQLWVGFHDALEQKVIEHLQTLFCPTQGCGTCIACMQIYTKQHHSMLWICPEKQYTLDDIASIGATIAFSLDAGQHYFFIIQKADLLTATCANSLLKSMEEPPPGYHFILLAERTETIVPTIRSRCLVTLWNTSRSITASPLYTYLTTAAPASAWSFLAALEQSKISEPESIELLDALILFWIEALKQALLEKDRKKEQLCEKIITTLSQAITTPPMPGSSKLLWKNLFLQIKS